jgi:hypothetical protein
MKRFRSQACAECGEKFTEDADIVVCPDCGYPCHRECWKGQCVNTAQHGVIADWKPRATAPVCTKCGHENPRGVGLCEACSSPLYTLKAPNGEVISLTSDLLEAAGIHPGDRFCGMDPKEEMDGVTIGELADFVGTSIPYYLPIFKLMKTTGKKFSFNLVCLLMPDFYFASRKMFSYWFFSAFMVSFFGLPFLYYSQPAETGTHIVMPLWLIITGLVLPYAYRLFMCLYGNWFYYKFAVRQIKEVRTYTKSRVEIQHSGGVSPLMAFLNIPLTFLFYILSFMAVASLFAENIPLT